MYQILISIKPEFVKRIMAGEKKFEFRKVECRRTVEKIIIYSTAPVMQVVGEAEVDDILVDIPQFLWEKTSENAGITKEFYDKYYENIHKAIAYKLKNIVEYEKPLKLDDFGVSNAPQSFLYIS